MNHQEEKGFTLIEVMTVIGMIGIISITLVPTYTGFMNSAREHVCNQNGITLNKLYEMELLYANKLHSDFLFEQFMLEQKGEVCPGGGTMTYMGDKVICNIHDREEEEVPIL